MRYALGLVVWLLATSGLLAADQTMSKSTSSTPGPIQLGILVGGTAWDMANLSPDKTDPGFQTAELHTLGSEPIIGVLLTNPNNYGLQYTCVYRDSLLGNDKTETVKAGLPCPNVPHNTQSLYVKSLSAELTSQPGGKIKISCSLFDYITKRTTETHTDLDRPPFTSPPSPTAPCATTEDTQRIVGVKIEIQPAPGPLLQLGILVSGKAWDLTDSSPDKTAPSLQTAELHTTTNQAIIGISLTNRNPKDNFQYVCVYRDSQNKEHTETVKAGVSCPDFTLNTDSAYLESLSIDQTSMPSVKIDISCQLFDSNTKSLTSTDTSANPAIPCATTKDTQRIVGVTIKIRSPPPPTPTLQLGILVTGKGWNLANAPADKTIPQTVELHTPASEAIAGIWLANYALRYTCVYRDSQNAEKTETVKAGVSCPDFSHNTDAAYLKSLSVESTSTPAAKIDISCTLYDSETKVWTQTDTGANPSTPCATTTDTQRIVGARITI
jgi:hypothetical protein